jgi:hypothetical protein
MFFRGLPKIEPGIIVEGGLLWKILWPLMGEW